MTDLVMRDARPDDQDAIRDLTFAAYHEYAGVMGPANWGFYWQSILDTLADVRPAQQLAAEQAGHLVGTGLLYPAGTAMELPGGGTHTLQWPEIRLVAVAPEARGQGVGAALVQESLRRARQAGATEVTLHTTDMMAAAMRLYLRLGFERFPEIDFQPIPEVTVKGFRYRQG